jgi:hypothetical protein
MDEPRSDEDDAVEDLDVPEEDAEDVKGGYLKISGIEGESADSKHKGW